MIIVAYPSRQVLEFFNLELFDEICRAFWRGSRLAIFDVGKDPDFWSRPPITMAYQGAKGWAQHLIGCFFMQDANPEEKGKRVFRNRNKKAAHAIPRMKHVLTCLSANIPLHSFRSRRSCFLLCSHGHGNSIRGSTITAVLQ